MNKTARLWLYLAASFLAASLGGIATGSSVKSWYPTLVKPSWNPPSWVFGPVWSVLYLGIAVVGYRLWTFRDKEGARGTLALWWIQLGLNALWSVIFFGLRRPGYALGEVLILWICLVAIQIRLFRVDRRGAWIWVAYLSWVSFASVLNAAIWRLN